MGKGKALILAGLAALALLGAVAFWVLQMSADFGPGDGTPAARAPVLDGRETVQSLTAPELPVPGAEAGAAPLSAGAGVAQPATPPAPLPDAVRFTGRVVDRDGQPVVGASLLHLPSGPLRKDLGVFDYRFEKAPDYGRLARATTGADGRFALDVRDRPPEQASIEQGDGRYRDFTGLVPKLLVIHAALEATAFACHGWTGGARDWGDIVAQPGAGVTGRAVDDDGRPLEGVALATPPLWDGPDWDSPGFRSLRPLWQAVSGADGCFALDSLWAGTFELEWRAPGRAAVVRKPVLVAGETLDLGDVTLSQGRWIEGLVTDLQGRPVPGARVLGQPALFRFLQGVDTVLHEFQFKVGANGSMIDIETVADEAGAFRLTGLLAEHPAYHVIAGAPGFEPVKAPAVVPNGPPLALALPPAATLLLTLVDATTGEPVQDTTVKGRRLEGEERTAQAATLDVASDAAALTAAGVPPPHAGVVLLSPAGPLRNAAVVSAPGRATRGFVLPGVPAGQRVTQVVKLAREGRLHGRVLDPDGAPIAGATLRLQAPTDLRVDLPERSECTDAEGRWAFGALTGGDWRLSASAPGFVTGAVEEVTLRKELAVEHDVTLQRAGRIAGHVLRRGAPAPGLAVRARRLEDVEAQKAELPPGFIPGNPFGRGTRRCPTRRAPSRSTASRPARTCWTVRRALTWSWACRPARPPRSSCRRARSRWCAAA